MKTIVLTLSILSVAGCVSATQREARCQCFNTDGSKNGRCDFERLPGQPAIYSFMSTSAASVTPAQSPDFAEKLRKELSGNPKVEMCGG